jgi:hypothetical protein
MPLQYFKETWQHSNLLLLLLNELPAQLNAQQELITCSGVKTPPKHLFFSSKSCQIKKKRDNTQQQQQQQTAPSNQTPTQDTI